RGDVQESRHQAADAQRDRKRRQPCSPPREQGSLLGEIGTPSGVLLSRFPLSHQRIFACRWPSTVGQPTLGAKSRSPGNSGKSRTTETQALRPSAGIPKVLTASGRGGNVRGACS